MKKIYLMTLMSFIFVTISNGQDDISIDKKYTKEIERLAKNKKVKYAFGYIEEQRQQTTEDYIALTEILAAPFKENDRGIAFAKLLENAGVDSLWTDKVGNVIGLRKGTSGESGYVGIDAHLDVVFPRRHGCDCKKNRRYSKGPWYW
ncbi:hypothetical protein NYZ99_18165 [Maribacter litopenaei]|uniref:Peptidase family M20/M25/M40 n=1 Tax=Maribacter litopenaei TaxID=2976127 RepID=A0ABY5Y997_9FLAO|nr:hypothetical protein [Maribacter litopenaei]UWX54725.1 hypothetical protein NYZ99_18165 [Maribacter litopenaei]